MQNHEQPAFPVPYPSDPPSGLTKLELGALLIAGHLAENSDTSVADDARVAVAIARAVLARCAEEGGRGA